MDDYMKQEFSPPILSRRWITIKFRPNMMIYNRQHIISILESGLMFREDSVEVEQEAPSPELVWGAAGGLRGGWLTAGEGVASVGALAAAVAVMPHRSLASWWLVPAALYASVPALVRGSHRARCRGPLPDLLANLRAYLTLARRAAAALNEYHTLYTQLASVSSVVDSLHALLRRQQGSLCARCVRASTALRAAAPWLRGDTPALPAPHTLTQIHHAFLVYQSLLLRNIALAHCIPPPHIRKLYKNHNERIYWIHNVLIKELNDEIKEDLQALQIMYRLLKNSTASDSKAKKLGVAISSNWLYSDVHSGVARSCVELKVALSKSNSLDVFLDSCAATNQEFDFYSLNKDLDDLIDCVTKCLSTLQKSQIRLKKLKGKVEEPEVSEQTEKMIESAAILKIDDKEPETKDEVFYFVKTEDDPIDQGAGDLTTVPGKKEKENTKIVLSELKRKLGKREDLMRERERQALVKTMPNLKNVPEFPRQIEFDEFYERKGYIKKINRDYFLNLKNKPKYRCKKYKLNTKRDKNITKMNKYKIIVKKYSEESDIEGEFLEANSRLNVKSKLITISSKNNTYYINKWHKTQSINASKNFESSGMSDGLSDVEAGVVNKTVNQAINLQNRSVDLPVNVNQIVNDKIKFSKKDLELSASSSNSDTEYYQEQRQLLKDVRRHRVARRKNHPSHRPKDAPQRSIDNIDGKPIDNVDESLKPMEYSLGTGLAMASVLQVNNPRFLNMAQEEVFVGDGEVSDDSGNDEDA